MRSLLTAVARRLDPEAADRDDTIRAAMYLLAVVCQLATVAITWPLWQLREFPPNLPALGLPPISFGWIVLVSLLVAVVRPRFGVVFHGLTLVAACVWDQFRIEPQLLGLWVLMYGCTGRRAAWFARWFLATMWLWAGLHKGLSPDWFGRLSWGMVGRAGFDPVQWRLLFGIAVFAGETGLGVVAVLGLRRIAAVGCAMLHLGVLVFLSPLFYSWNESVWPWNFATALVGAWLFWTAQDHWPKRAVQWVVVLLLLLLPACYYQGRWDSHLSHILYSDYMPKGYIQRSSDRPPVKIKGWGNLRVPFPDSHRMFVQYFQSVGKPGQKLHIDDPRTAVDDRYFLMLKDGSTREIDRERFHQDARLEGLPQVVAGREPDDANAVFALARLGASTAKDERGNRHLVDLIAQADLSDDDLSALAGLPYLTELRLNGVPATDEAMSYLSELVYLELLYLNGTQITDAGLAKLAKLTRLKDLYLSGTHVSDAGLVLLKEMRDLEQLDLTGTKVTDAGLVHLQGLKHLDTLILDDTRVTPEGVGKLQQALPKTGIYFE